MALDQICFDKIYSYKGQLVVVILVYPSATVYFPALDSKSFVGYFSYRKKYEEYVKKLLEQDSIANVCSWALEEDFKAGAKEVDKKSLLDILFG